MEFIRLMERGVNAPTMNVNRRYPKGRIAEVWRESPTSEDDATAEQASKIIRSFTLAEADVDTKKGR